MKFSKLETTVILFLVAILVASIILAPKGSYIDSGKPNNETLENEQQPEEILPPVTDIENVNLEKEPVNDNGINDIDIVQNEEPECAEDDWGLHFCVSNVTPKGLTYHFEQKGGAPTGDLQYGSDYILEKLVENKWVKVDYIIPEENIAWTAEAYMIPREASTVETELIWTFFYGELPEGSYRIGKSVMDFRQSGDYDDKMYYAEFTL